MKYYVMVFAAFCALACAFGMGFYVSEWQHRATLAITEYAPSKPLEVPITDGTPGVASPKPSRQIVDSGLADKDGNRLLYLEPIATPTRGRRGSPLVNAWIWWTEESWLESAYCSITFTMDEMDANSSGFGKLGVPSDWCIGLK